MCLKNLSNNILTLNFLEINELISELENKLNLEGKSNLFSTNDLEVHEEKKISSEAPLKIEVILQAIQSDKKISVLKTVKTLLKLGLKESKDIVEKLPYIIKETSVLKEAEDLKQQLETAGGIVELKKL